MRLPSHLKKDHRTGIFSFRIVLPQADGSRKEKRVTLRTREPSEARLLAYRIHAELQGIQTVSRRNAPTVQEVLRNLQRVGGGHDLVIERNSRGAATRVLPENDAELKILPELIGRMAEGSAFSASIMGTPGRPALGFRVSDGIADFLKSLPVNTPKKTKLKK